MPPPPFICRAARLCWGWLRKSGIIDASDPIVAFEKFRDRLRVLDVARHAQRQGLEAAMGEKAAEGVEHAAGRVLQEFEPVDEIGIRRARSPRRR